MRKLPLPGLFLTLLCLALLLTSCGGGGTSVNAMLSKQVAADRPLSGAAKQVGATIWQLAMDGPYVAYAAGGRVYVWNVVTGATSAVKGRYAAVPRRAPPASQLAIAGKRVAWIKRQAFGITRASDKLYSAPVGGWAHLLERAFLQGTEHATRTSGDWIGGVVGSGRTLVVSTWKSKGTVASNQKLSRITPTGLRPIVAGSGAIVAESVNGGHIAVLRSTAAWPASQPATPTTKPSVGIYSTGGTLLREIVLNTPVPPPLNPGCGCNPSTIQNSIALVGHRLVVLTETTVQQPDAGFMGWHTKLQIFKWTTGALLHSWPLSITPDSTTTAAPLAAYGRFAAIETRRRLHLIDLTTGKDLATAASSGTECPAAIGPRGLVYAPEGPYAYNHSGQIIFVPMAKLRTLK